MSSVEAHQYECCLCALWYWQGWWKISFAKACNGLAAVEVQASLCRESRRGETMLQTAWQAGGTHCTQ